MLPESASRTCRMRWPDLGADSGAKGAVVFARRTLAAAWCTAVCRVINFLRGEFWCNGYAVLHAACVVARCNRRCAVCWKRRSVVACIKIYDSIYWLDAAPSHELCDSHEFVALLLQGANCVERASNRRRIKVVAQDNRAVKSAVHNPSVHRAAVPVAPVPRIHAPLNNRCMHVLANPRRLRSARCSHEVLEFSASRLEKQLPYNLTLFVHRFCR